MGAESRQIAVATATATAAAAAVIALLWQRRRAEAPPPPPPPPPPEAPAEPPLEPRGGQLAVDGVPRADAAVAARLGAYEAARGAALLGFFEAPEADSGGGGVGGGGGGGGLLISTRFGETAQVHHVRAPLGARRQLTFLTEPATSCAPAPRGAPRRGFVYGADAGGDEQEQFFFHDAATGRAARLTVR